MSLGRTIAVVDDNADILFIVKEMLTWVGYDVICSRNSKEFFASLEKQRPDLIILDIMMPGTDGFSVLQKLKEDSETSSIPVMFLTAKAEYKNALQVYQRGADYCVMKPFTRDQLLEGINLLVGHSRVNNSRS